MVSEVIAFAFAGLGQNQMLRERHGSIVASYAVLVLGKDSPLFNTLKLMTCSASGVEITSEKLQVTQCRLSHFTHTGSVHVLLTSSAPAALTIFIIFAHV